MKNVIFNDLSQRVICGTTIWRDVQTWTKREVPRTDELKSLNRMHSIEWFHKRRLDHTQFIGKNINKDIILKNVTNL